MKPLQIQFQAKQSVATFKEMMMNIHTRLVYIFLWTSEMCNTKKFSSFNYCSVFFFSSLVTFLSTCVDFLSLSVTFNMRWVILVLAVNAQCAVKWIAEQKNDWTEPSSSLSIFVCALLSTPSSFLFFFNEDFILFRMFLMRYLVLRFFSISLSLALQLNSLLIWLRSFLFSTKVPNNRNAI